MGSINGVLLYPRWVITISTLVLPSAKRGPVAKSFLPDWHPMCPAPVWLSLPLDYKLLEGRDCVHFSIYSIMSRAVNLLNSSLSVEKWIEVSAAWRKEKRLWDEGATDLRSLPSVWDDRYECWGHLGRYKMKGMMWARYHCHHQAII